MKYVPDDSLSHQVAIAGGGKSISEKEFVKHLKPGTTVTKVQWDGCMATIRNERDCGEILRHEERQGCRGVVIAYSAREGWEALSELRIVGDQIEAWH